MSFPWILIPFFAITGGLVSYRSVLLPTHQLFKNGIDIQGHWERKLRLNSALLRELLEYGRNSPPQRFPFPCEFLGISVNFRISYDTLHEEPLTSVFGAEWSYAKNRRKPLTTFWTKWRQTGRSWNNFSAFLIQINIEMVSGPENKRKKFLKGLSEPARYNFLFIDILP